MLSDGMDRFPGKFCKTFGETLPDITLPGPADVIFKDSINVFGV
jgi:hypothetical protein